MTSREYQKSCAANFLISVKYLMVASSMLVLLMLPRFSLPYKMISVSWELLKSKIKVS